MQYWLTYLLTYLKTWFYQLWHRLDAVKMESDEEMLWGFLKILGFLILAFLVVLIFSRKKSQEMM